MNPENKYILLRFFIFLFFSKLIPQDFCKSWDLTLFIDEDITQSKIKRSVGMGTFHQHKSRGCSFDYYSAIRPREIKEWYSLILRCTPTKFGGFMSSDHMITSRDSQEWQCFILIWITTTFSDCSIRYSCTMTFLICPQITWSTVMVSLGWTLFGNVGR